MIPKWILRGYVIIGLFCLEFYKDGKYDLDFKNKDSDPSKWVSNVDYLPWDSYNSHESKIRILISDLFCVQNHKTHFQDCYLLDIYQFMVTILNFMEYYRARF